MDTTIDAIVPPAPAQVTFAATQLSASGTILHRECEGVLIQLDCPLQGHQGNSQLAGSAVWITFMSGSDICRVSGSVLSENGPFLAVQVTDPGQRVDRRNRMRLPCKLPAMYRAARSDSAHGVWHEAEARDVTFNGMRLWVPGTVSFPGKVELQLCLPSEMYRDGAGSVGGRKSENPDVVKGTGVARHGRFTDGGTLVGVRLDQLAPDAQLKLDCYLEWLKTSRASKAA